jgi:hypothetical protein
MKNVPRSSLDIYKNEHRISHTAGESALRERQIVEEHGCKLLEEDKSENPRNVPHSPLRATRATGAATSILSRSGVLLNWVIVEATGSNFAG